MELKYTCPVCGYPKLKETPRPRGGGGSYEICPSCGFQFGVSDEDRGLSYSKWREQWRAGGMQWSSQRKPPKGWNPIAQLSKILPPDDD